jgi:quinol monooxygenase YgiN
MAIRVVAHLQASPGKEQQLRAVLLSLLEPTRRESGCREYRLYQNTQDDRAFVFVEEWDDDAALDTHLQAPHLQAAIAEMQDLVAGPPQVGRYSLVG